MGCDHIDRSLLPWSHRQGVVVQVSVTVLSGACSGAVGTLAHRMGASMNLPYGLALAFAVLGLSAWCARARLGVSGLALHLIASSAIAWGLAVGGSAGDVLVPIGFSAEVPFFSQYAGYIWLYGLIVLQVLLLAWPRAWFVIPPRKEEPCEGPEPLGGRRGRALR